MIHSLFLINTTGDIFLEKHWKSVIPRTICDYLFEEQRKVQDPNDVPAVIASPHHYLISIFRSNVFYVAVSQTEVPPLFVIEFLHRVCDTFVDYFSECNEQTIIDHIVVVYELLEEMLDNGFPLATESNILKELIKPPNIINKVVNTVTGGTNMSSELPTGSLSNVPWRRSGVRYANNEIYFDITEEIDCIIDKAGSTVNLEIHGFIDSFSRLSGMPDLSLTFMNAKLLDDVSFHPCVRLKRWENEKILSFMPPDGQFRLASYHLTSSTMMHLPVYVQPQISFITGGTGRFDLTIGQKASVGKSVEQVVATIKMPSQILNCNLTQSVGTISFDPVKKVLRWEIGKINQQKSLPTLRGNITLVSGADPPEDMPVIMLEFRIGQFAISGIKVNRLDVYGERYKPFKGVKYVTKAGKFQVRT